MVPRHYRFNHLQIPKLPFTVHYVALRAAGACLEHFLSRLIVRSTSISKQGVWDERRWGFHLPPKHLGWLIDVFLEALIALRDEMLSDRGSSRGGVSLPQWNPVYIEEILLAMEPVILADNDPTIAAIDPEFPSRFGLNCLFGYKHSFGL